VGAEIVDVAGELAEFREVVFNVAVIVRVGE
jgi:hypothetical protein